jgi:hypothetical protein
MRTTKLLGLAMAAAVVAACNGISPSSPNSATVATDDASALVAAPASKESADGSLCRDITEVKLALLRSPWPGFDTVGATYFSRGLLSRCRMAPIWSSRPNRRLVPTEDPFIVKATRTRPPSPVLVIAKAPNGIQGTLRVQ